jgi:hypothetical protein
MALLTSFKSSSSCTAWWEFRLSLRKRETNVGQVQRKRDRRGKGKTTFSRTHYIRDNRKIKLLGIEMNRISRENARGKIIRLCSVLQFARKKIHGETYTRWAEAIQACNAGEQDYI